MVRRAGRRHRDRRPATLIASRVTPLRKAALPLRPNALLPVLALACLLSTVAACDNGSESAATSPRVTATKTVTMRPFTPDGRTAPWVTVVGDATGACYPSGVDAGNPQARRCFTDATSVALDPCFVPAPGSAGVALCLPDPTSGQATRVAIYSDLDPNSESTSESTDTTDSGAVPNIGPWFVELASGVRCEAATGVDAMVDGLPLTYSCDDGGFLYGPVDTGGRVWTAHYQRDGAAHTQVAAVRTAWR